MMEKDEIAFRHIAVEGVMKSGKTLLANLLSQKMGGRVILDKSDNPYLKDFYEEKDGGAFLAQLVFLINRYHQQVRLAQRELFEERTFCDYIFEKDKIYAYQTLTDEELVVYDRIYGILAERLSKPDLVIYLQISLPTLTKRLAREGSPIEKNISERYLEDLVEAYDYFFFNFQVAPLLVIRADSLDLTRDVDLEAVIQQVRQMKTRQQFFVPAGHASKEFRKNK